MYISSTAGSIKSKRIRSQFKMEHQQVICNFLQKLKNEFETFLENFRMKSVNDLQVNCYDIFHVRICAHHVPPEVEYFVDSVENFDVGSPEFYESYMSHHQYKALYFRECMTGLCSHTDSNACRIIARFHAANVILMQHIQNCFEDGIEYTQMAQLNRPSFSEMEDFDYISREIETVLLIDSFNQRFQ